MAPGLSANRTRHAGRCSDAPRERPPKLRSKSRMIELRTLTEIAKAAPDHNTFIKRALTIPEIQHTDELSNLVMDTTYYNTLKNS